LDLLEPFKIGSVKNKRAMPILHADEDEGKFIYFKIKLI
jgi:hypothetical protein